jgi:predicted nucleic acid-binding Zn ribbon protein
MPNEAVEEKRSNRKLLLLFLIGVLIALLPWFVLAAS